jgi:hypothetical protein
MRKGIRAFLIWPEGKGEVILERRSSISTGARSISTQIGMEIKYSKHLERRLLLRKIDYNLPRKIFMESRERFIDEDTNHLIATMEVELYNKLRNIMIAYVVIGDSSKILTIHPLQEGQQENRIKSGRWRRV